jgi:hypothetical protein
VSDADIHLPFSVGIPMVSGEFNSIKVQYYESTQLAMVALYWESPSLAMEIIPSNRLYYETSTLPIGSTTLIIAAEDIPMAPIDVIQSDSSTFSQTDITIEWNAPSDNGCAPVLDY